MSVITRNVSCHRRRAASVQTLTPTTWKRLWTIYWDWKYTINNSTMRGLRNHRPTRYSATRLHCINVEKSLLVFNYSLRPPTIPWLMVNSPTWIVSSRQQWSWVAEFANSDWHRRSSVPRRRRHWRGGDIDFIVGELACRRLGMSATWLATIPVYSHESCGSHVIGNGNVSLHAPVNGTDNDNGNDLSE